MKVFFYKIMHSSVVVGGVNSFLPMLLSFYLFYFILPQVVVSLSSDQAQSLLLFVTIVTLLNNNNLGLSPYITWGVVNRNLGQTTLFYVLVFLIILALVTSLTMSVYYGMPLAVVSLIIPAIAASTVIRGIYEGFSKFFQSFFIKLMLNSLLCIVCAEYWGSDLKLIPFFIILNLFTILFGLSAYKRIRSIDLQRTSPFDWRSYGSFFLMFLVGLFYFYSDRLYILNYLPSHDFSKFVIEFEQIIKLALPLNLALVFIFPVLSKKGCKFSENKSEILVFLIFWILYLVSAPFFYLSLTDGEGSYLLVITTLFSVGVFMLLQRVVSLWFRNFSMILILIVIPNALFGIVLVNFYINIYCYIILKSLLFMLTVGLAFLVDFVGTRRRAPKLC